MTNKSDLDNRDLNAVYVYNETVITNKFLILLTAYKSFRINITDLENVYTNVKIKKRLLFRKGYYIKLKIKFTYKNKYKHKYNSISICRLSINKLNPIIDCNEAISFSEYILQKIHYNINSTMSSK